MFALLLTVLFALFSPAPPVATGASPAGTAVTVAISSPAEGGDIHVAVYANDREFATEERNERGDKKRALPRLTQLEVDLPATGTYVLAAYHDVNGNGKLDRNLFGIPTEPYGFPRRPGNKWRRPDFDEVSTNIRPGESISIELRYWREY